ncbi:MAG TPA: hypothetical protein VGN16_23025 [Acidobacteriaceae bacterium]|jgi:hypothetical protein
MRIALHLFLATVLMTSPLAAQTGPGLPELTTRCDPPAGSLGKLTHAQKDAFMESQNQFIAGHYADALAALRTLLAQVPANIPAQTALAERAAEAAIEAGERTYAISLLKPIEEHDGHDCLARVLLGRAHAEEGHAADRDAEVSALVALHKAASGSSAGKLDGFLLEKHVLKGGGSVSIWYVLRPWGPHHTYLYSEILDVSGGMVVRLELDSDDGDQVYFKEIHPELVAKGDRRYSLDAFAVEEVSPGYKKEQHALIQFYEGWPPYDTVRERILAIAERASTIKQ